MVSSAEQATPIRLLVPGLRWPIETFLRRTLERVAARGILVTVGAYGLPESSSADDSRVRFVRLPDESEPAVVAAMALAGGIVGLAASRPRRLGRVSDGARTARAPDLRTRFRRIRRHAALARLDADVVHFQWNSVAMDALPVFDVWDAPVVVSCRGAQINIRPHTSTDPDYVPKLRESFRRAAAVHCVSQAILDAAVELGLDRAKAVIIRPAVDVGEYHPAERAEPADHLRIVMLGGLGWRKGYEYALCAVRRLADAGIAATMNIIGDGSDRERILYTIGELELGDVVRLRGSLRASEVPEALRAADVLLHASVSEGISNAVLEAMASGLAVVTADSGGMREAITDGVDGLVVPVRDPEAMARALERLARDPESRRAMGRAARETAVARFDLEHQADAFAALYRRLAGGARDPNASRMS